MWPEWKDIVFSLILTGKGKLGRPRRRWEGSIRIWLSVQVIGLIGLGIGIIGGSFWMLH